MNFEFINDIIGAQTTCQTNVMQRVLLRQKLKTVAKQSLTTDCDSSASKTPYPAPFVFEPAKKYMCVKDPVCENPEGQRMARTRVHVGGVYLCIAINNCGMPSFTGDSGTNFSVSGLYHHLFKEID